jgi:hypothetical protein
VRERHAGPDAEDVAHVDAGVQRLARLLPVEIGGQAENAWRGRALGRHDAVPGAVGCATAAAHVGLPRQDEDQLPAADACCCGGGGGGGEEEDKKE